ncbi:MarR family winged helix-turn-helix transcriptional regulator [Pseudaestuariivita atlantica]|uniref:MarR family winged helix-turn-helix transcriptional regulator n=1 Tax=Pseudaestuariivita atlantica TaxID=1317121 RepID=UPI00067C0F2E|nr:MarR family transcriptional regulator [Pseudaestuariivita atlantica]
MSTKFDLDAEQTGLARAVDRLVRRIQAGLTERAPAIDAHRVGPFGGMLLLAIDDLQPVPMHVLSRAMTRDKSQLTRAVKSLEGKGLVVRERCVDDARAWRLSLTGEGAAVVRDISGVLSEVVGEVLSPLDPEDRDALARILSRL